MLYISAPLEQLTLTNVGERLEKKYSLDSKTPLTILKK